MRLIVTHEQPDFDALASLALAKLLFPGSVATVQGAISPPMQTFLRLYRDQLDLVEPEHVDLGAVRELVVVDTADPNRIKPFDVLLGRVPVTLYDHHPRPTHPIAASRGITERLGATATLLTRELMATDVTIPAPVASLALLGIHEDTGNLSFDSTQPDDYRAAAHLLASGANLQLVRRFTHDALNDEQRAFREALLANARSTTVAGRHVVVAAFTHPNYVAGVSGLVNDLLDLHAADAALAVVRMDARTLVFARSNERFDSAAALAEAIGGAGHPGAAYGKSDQPPEEAAERVLSALAHHATPVLTARDLMSAPVKSIADHATVAEAQQRLLLYGHNGMPVLDPVGRVVGVVSRRDLDRALRHGLGRSRVSGFMSRTVVSASPSTTLAELEELVLRHNIGRIPIIDGADLVGIVTRTDLIGARHRDLREDDPAAALLERLPPSAAHAIERGSALAGEATLLLVGGTVRDLLLGTGLKDLDLVVEGDTAERFGSRLQQVLGGTLSCHVEFGTCTLQLDDGLVVDLATAREEVYARPGALPDVTPSTLRKDLSRRDFSVNAMALRLHPKPPQLIDPFSGETDLRARQLRVLHPLSFIEDPTRILRGARLAGRLGFHFESVTAEQARAALVPEILANVSRSRLRAELELTLSEPRVAPALHRLEELGAMRAMFRLSYDGAPISAAELVEALDALRREGDVPDEAYLLALLLGAENEAVETHMRAFHWPRRYLTVRTRLLRVLAPGREAPTDRVRDEELEELDEAARFLVRAADTDLAARIARLEEEPPRRKVRGRDVVALGLPPGPAVGRVLDAVARARAVGAAASFEDELALARRLVQELGQPPDDVE